jgi:hypothetical protein
LERTPRVGKDPLYQNDFFEFIKRPTISTKLVWSFLCFLGSIIEIEIVKTRAKTSLKEPSVKHEERDITGVYAGHERLRLPVGKNISDKFLVKLSDQRQGARDS